MLPRADDETNTRLLTNSSGELNGSYSLHTHVVPQPVPASRWGPTVTPDYICMNGYHETWLPSYAQQYGFDDLIDTVAANGRSLGLQNATSATTGESLRQHLDNEKAQQDGSTPIGQPLHVDNLGDITNDTLGTQEVFVVSLPSRRDKHDAFAVQALASNITYTVAEGVDGESVPKKALPYSMDLKPVEIGCWRAHMNIFEDILDRKIATALIFEDDADWDVTLRQQLRQFAKGARYITSTEAHDNFIPHSPYGEDWDILWLGHCNSRVTEGDNKRFVLEHDPTVVPMQPRQWWERPITHYWDRAPDADFKTRVVFRTSDSSCTTAYIISLRGAQKALYHLSMNPSDQPIDNGLGRMCGDPAKDFRCISSFPTLIGISKPAGSSSRGSDVDHNPAEETVSEVAHSERLVYSTRMNLDKLILPYDGESSDVMRSAYPDSSPEIRLADIVVPEGYKFEFSDEELESLRVDQEASKEAEVQERIRQQKIELETEKQAIFEKEQALKEQEHQAEQGRIEKQEQGMRDGLGELQNAGGETGDGTKLPDPLVMGAHGENAASVEDVGQS